MFYSGEAEMASLGCCLLNKEALLTTIENLKVEDFYKDKHKYIYRYMLEIFHRNISVDVVTLTEVLHEEKILDTVGGVEYLMGLMDSVPNIQNIEAYNQIIKKKSQQRKIWEILTKVKGGKLDLGVALNSIEGLPDLKVSEATFKDILHNTLDSSLEGTEFTFTIDVLNKYLGGLDGGELLTIGGYTSQSKSALAIQMAINQAKKGRRVLFLSTEMTPAEISRRILGNMGSINVMDIRKGMLTPEERGKLESIISDIGSEWELNIKKIFSISDIHKYYRKYSPEIVFLDYIQNLGGSADYKTATMNIKELQALTLQYEIATICVSQLNRNKEEVREPKLTDLRDTGRLEECSNMVIFLYWKTRLQQINVQRFGGEDPEEVELLIAKNRDGTVGKSTLCFYPEFSKFENRVNYAE